MDIKFSRHAKRRAKLYGIPEATVTEILESMSLRHGEHKIIGDVSGFQYPLKIVVSVEGDSVTVITNYLLKKRRKK